MCGEYRYGFNGKENDTDLSSSQLIQDYGFRVYNPVIGKFLSVDPLTKSYPMLTPYQFASNRPIDGVDLDGKEWDRSITIDNTGKTHIHFTVNIKPTVSEEIGKYSSRVNSYLNATKEHFSNVMSVYDPLKNVQYSGSLIYDENATIVLQALEPIEKANNDDLAVLGYSIWNPLKEIGEIGVPVGVTVTGSLEKKFLKGKTYLFSEVDFANNAVHEILHSGGVLHPTDKKSAWDVNLNKVSPNNYWTKPWTTQDINKNIMLYDFHYVNGVEVKENLDVNEIQDKVTPGQLEVIDGNIKKGRVNGEPLFD